MGERQPSQDIEVERFVRALCSLSAPEIHTLATELESHHERVTDDIAWWRATVAIDRTLRCHGKGRAASLAAAAARRAVVRAAEASGMTLPDPRVTTVARAAGDVARGMVAAATDRREGIGAQPARTALLAILADWPDAAGPLLRAA